MGHRRVDGRAWSQLKAFLFLLRKEFLNVITFRLEESVPTKKIFRSYLVIITDDNGLQIWCLALSKKADVSVVKTSEEGGLYLASISPMLPVV
jgi:hypothetical protein